ncbi:MAG: tetratricopeptide repeat protein [Euryarchaeota archaeon]|nr:tetratricopeptide repeat protein [Euryarchaeota archaeon]MBT5254735.1 tetratricopeptide repeat protein [Euryarchaeota archaeon]
MTVMTDGNEVDSVQNNNAQTDENVDDYELASMAAALESAGLGSMLEEIPVAVEVEENVGQVQSDEIIDTSTTMAADVFPELDDIDDNEEMVRGLITVGEERSRKNDAKGALAAFNKAIALDPSCDMAWFNRGVLLEAQKDARGAKQSFQICIDLNPDHAPATANLASILERMGELIPAYDMAMKGLVFYPGHPALVDITKRCKSAEANIPVTDIPRIVASPNSYEEATVVAVMDDVGVADMEAVLQEAVYHDHDGDSHLDYSELKSAASVVAATEEVIVRLEANPVATPQPVEVIADTVQEVVEEEIVHSQEVEEVVEQPVIDIDSLVEEATELIRSGDAAGGLSILKPHLKTTAAENADAWRVAGGAMARLELDSHAIAAITHAQSLDPSNSSGWFNLGSIHQRGENFSEAKSCYQKALEIQPDYHKAAIKLSDLSKQLSDVETYLMATRIVAKIDSNDERVAEMAEILIEIAEGEANVLDSTQGLPPTLPVGPELAQEALGIIGDGTSSLHARAYTAISDHHKSVTTWKSLIQEDGDNAANWRGLARSLEEAGDLATAQKCHSKANEIENGPAPSVVVQEPVAMEQTETVVEEIQQEIEPLGQPLTPVPQPEEQLEAIVESPSDILLAPVTPNIADAPAKVEENQQANDLLMAPIEPRPANNIIDENPAVDLAKAALDATHAASLNVVGETMSKSVANQDIAWYNKGVQLIEDGKYKEALTCFDRALPSFKDDDEMVIRILNGRGNSYYYMEEYPRCVEAYHQAMLIRPKEVRGQTLYNMGTAYAEMERFPDAIKCFEQSIPRGLSTAEAKRAKDQIRRCTILNKERQKKIRKKS